MPKLIRGGIGTSNESKRLIDAKENAKAIERETKRKEADVRVDELPK